MSELRDTVPVEVIEAVDPVGKLTTGIDDDCVLVKSVELEVIWSVAPLSKIQGLVNTELVEASEKEDRPVAFA